MLKQNVGKISGLDFTKMVVRIANREYPDFQKQSDLGLCNLSRPFRQPISVQKLKDSYHMHIQGNSCMAIGLVKNS